MKYLKSKIRMLFVEARHIDSLRLPIDENLSPYMLATFLKDYLPEIEFEFDFAQSHNFLSFAGRNAYNLCGVYSTAQAWNKACDIAATMRNYGVETVVVGPHIKLLPESLSPDFTAWCIGQGEWVLKEFVKIYLQSGELPASELTKVPGIVFFAPDGLKINSPSGKKNAHQGFAFAI